MSTRRLIINCGAAETRAALIEDDLVKRFWFGPARGDEHRDADPRPGRVFTGRIISTDKRLEAAFVDIGAHAPGFLPLKKNAPPLNDGALAAVIVKRAPRGGKGATLAISKENPGADVGPLGPVVDAAVMAVRAFSQKPDEIIVDTGAAKATLDAAGIDTTIEHRDRDLFNLYGADEALETSFQPVRTLSTGGRITINETEALIAIDVDTAAGAASSSARLASKVNQEAARNAAIEISRREIGGKIIIDFLPAHGAAREALNQILKHEFPTAQKAVWTPGGLFAFVLPRPYASLLERFTVESRTEPVSGRQFTADWQARAALRQAEQALRSERRGIFCLSLGVAVHAHLDANSIYMERLIAHYGARLTFQLDEKLEGRTFDLSHQR